MPKTNVELATDLFACMRAGNVAGVLALMTDDATWEIPGKPERFPSAGKLTKQQFGRLMERMRERARTELDIHPTHMIAEGDYVAVEAEGAMELKNGRKYRQRYHIKLRYENGKLAESREYLDTQHSHDIWFAE